MKFSNNGGLSRCTFDRAQKKKKTSKHLRTWGVKVVQNKLWEPVAHCRWDLVLLIHDSFLTWPIKYFEFRFQQPTFFLSFSILIRETKSFFLLFLYKRILVLYVSRW